MNSLELLQLKIEMIEANIRTCHSMMRAMEERGNIDAAKSWATKGLKNKTILMEAKLEMFIYYRENNTNTHIQIA